MLALLLACVRLPPAPAPGPVVDVARDSLPEMTLQVFQISTGHLSARMSFEGGRGKPLPIIGYAYVLEHPEAGRVVIDPGYGQRTVSHPQQIPGRGPARFAGLEMGTPLVEQLTEQGAASVQRILLTHTHTDHAGGIEDFPGVRVQVVDAEWEFGSRKRTLRATVPLPDHDTIPTDPLLFEDGAYGSFDAHADVFGDGSLIALPTPGHTPGHTSFLIHLSTGSFLVTGDAAWFDAHWQQPALKGNFAAGVIEVDGEANGEALWKLRALTEQVPDLVVLSGHDPANLTRISLGQVYR